MAKRIKTILYYISTLVDLHLAWYMYIFLSLRAAANMPFHFWITLQREIYTYTSRLENQIQKELLCSDTQEIYCYLSILINISTCTHTHTMFYFLFLSLRRVYLFVMIIYPESIEAVSWIYINIHVYVEYTCCTELSMPNKLFIIFI